MPFAIISWPASIIISRKVLTPQARLKLLIVPNSLQIVAGLARFGFALIVEHVIFSPRSSIALPSFSIPSRLMLLRSIFNGIPAALSALLNCPSNNLRIAFVEGRFGSALTVSQVTFLPSAYIFCKPAITSSFVHLLSVAARSSKSIMSTSRALNSGVAIFSVNFSRESASPAPCI